MTIQKNGFNEKGFSGHRVFFTFCLKKVDFLAGGGMNPLFALIREVSPKKVSFFTPSLRGGDVVLYYCLIIKVIYPLKQQIFNAAILPFSPFFVKGKDRSPLPPSQLRP